MAMYNNLDKLPEEIQALLMDELLHSDVQGINITDGDANVLYINDTHYFVTGHTKSMYFKSDGTGKNMQELIDNGIVSNSASIMVRKSGKVVDVRQTSSAGKTFNIHAVPIFDKNGRLVLILNELTDLTEYVRMQKQVNEITYERKSNEGIRNVARIDYQSVAMRELIEKSKLVADTDATIMITGVSGTAKPDVATFIHENSKRKNKSFFVINCSAAPEALLEAELFGYVPGASPSGGSNAKAGLMEQAAGGTLFIDGIGDMPKSVQAKLLKVLREREFVRLGGRSIMPVDFRLIVSTNLDLRKECDEGHFLIDLYYELSVIELHIPSINDCREDIPLLVDDYLKIFNNKYGTKKTIDLESMRILTQHNWKGDKRELRNVVERLVIQGSSKSITAKDIQDAIGIIRPEDRDAKRIKSVDFMPGATLNEMMESYERELLEEFSKLYRTESEMAQRLGTNQSTISRKMQKYGLK